MECGKSKTLYLIAYKVQNGLNTLKSGTPKIINENNF